MTDERKGHARLAQWLERSKLEQREAARLIEIDPTQLNKILLGHRRPGLDNAVKIEAATGIPVEAWVASSVVAAAPPASDTDDFANIGKA